MKNTLATFNQLRPITVGFDSLFDRFERIFENDFANSLQSNYPPYNIVRTGDYTYDIEVALAGFNKKDIEVTYADNVLTVESKRDSESEKDADNGAVIHRGISKRYFSRSFTIADDVEIKGAELKDGLLKVSMERVIPESKKSRTIEIK